MTPHRAFASMPDRRRRPLSLGVAVLVLVSAAGSLAATVRAYRERAESIGALTDDVARLGRVLDHDGPARPSPEDARDDAPDILAADPETATALIPSRLRALGGEGGAVRVEWTRQLPPQVGDLVTAVRASIKLRLPASQVGRVINALESDVPALLLDAVQVSPAQGPATAEGDAGIDGAMTLIATVRIYASNGRAAIPGRPPAGSHAPAPDTRP